MTKAKRTVFLTGGTGNMGWAGFQELYKRKDRFDIRLLARDSKKNHKMLDKNFAERERQVQYPYLDDVYLPQVLHLHILIHEFDLQLLVPIDCLNIRFFGAFLQIYLPKSIRKQ